jgi:hypothetical protein
VKGRNVDKDSLSELFDEKIQAARKGDSDAAKWILRGFCAAVAEEDDEGKPLRGPSGLVVNIRPAVLDYLAECFQQILSGVRADKALGINKGEPGARRKPRNETLDRHVQLCREVMSLKAKGATVKNAISKVADKRGLKKRAVETAWKDRSANIGALLITRMATKFNRGK